jgi:ammonia channel protein AmtB
MHNSEKFFIKMTFFVTDFGVSHKNEYEGLDITEHNESGYSSAKQV